MKKGEKSIESYYETIQELPDELLVILMNNADKLVGDDPRAKAVWQMANDKRVEGAQADG